MPIGGGSFIKAEVATTETLVVGLGAGVSTEKSRNEARQIVEQRIEELQKSRNSFQQQLSQVIERMRTNRQQLDEISVKLSSGRQTGDVRKTKSGT